MQKCGTAFFTCNEQIWLFYLTKRFTLWSSDSTWNLMNSLNRRVRWVQAMGVVAAATPSFNDMHALLVHLQPQGQLKRSWAFLHSCHTFPSSLQTQKIILWDWFGRNHFWVLWPMRLVCWMHVEFCLGLFILWSICRYNRRMAEVWCSVTEDSKYDGLLTWKDWGIWSQRTTNQVSAKSRPLIHSILTTFKRKEKNYIK